jgi:iron complex transport system substrate-binding protein
VKCSLLLCLTLVWHSANAQIVLADEQGHTIMLSRPAQRIVSLLPSLTETVCALKACDRLVGTDRYSNWPQQVQALPKLGGLEDTQIEAIVALKPDLVLAAVSSRAVERLQALGLTVLALEPQNWAGTQRAIDIVAKALGDVAAGAVLVTSIDKRIQTAAARVPMALRGRKVYFEVGAPYAAGEASFVGELLTRLQLSNVVPASLGAFPQLNPEFVIRAQPELLMASQSNLAEMASRPGWRGLRALQKQQFCGFAPAVYDSLVRPGPRLGEAAEAIADCLATIKP